MLRPRGNRIPVTDGQNLLEMADCARARVLMRAANVKVILRHGHTIVELQLLDYGSKLDVPARWGNPQKLSSNLEAPDNPPRVWKFKRLQDFPVRT